MLILAMKSDFLKFSVDQSMIYPKIPLTLIGEGGSVSSYPQFSSDLMRFKEDEFWAGDALGEIESQFRKIRRACPELLRNFHAQGGEIVITQGDPSLFEQHILGHSLSPEVSRGVPFGMALNFRDTDGNARIANIFWDEGLFLEGSWATVAHEMTHTADRLDTEVLSSWKIVESVKYGRHTDTELFRAIVNLEEGTNPKSVSADIRQEVRHYDEKERLHEYLPRMMERYVAGPRESKNSLSDLEISYIENVFLPDVGLRASQEHQKTASMLSKINRPLLSHKLPPEAVQRLLEPMKSHIIKGTNMSLHPDRDALREKLMGITQSIIPDAQHFYNTMKKIGSRSSVPAEGDLSERRLEA